MLCWLVWTIFKVFIEFVTVLFMSSFSGLEVWTATEGLFMRFAVTELCPALLLSRQLVADVSRVRC